MPIVITFFRSGNIFGRRLLSENSLLEYYSTSKIFLHRSIFSYGYLERECEHVVWTAVRGGKASSSLQQWTIVSVKV